MRGKAGTESSTPTSARITPAYAGKRNGQSPTMLLRRDHPRVCGEKLPVFGVLFPIIGSPPRMRGKDYHIHSVVFGLGITPAYAGKRSRKSDCRYQSEDHPRVCGEKGTRYREIIRSLGSPPRMRGKGNVSNNHEQRSGITPAYAGKSRERLRD